MHFEAKYGREALEAAWKKEALPLPLAFVEELSNFYSVRFGERLCEALTRASADPEFLRKAAVTSASPEALGFIFYMFRAMGDPKLIYEKSVELGPTYNRVGKFTIEHATRTEMRLAYRSTVTEHGRNLCVLRQGTLAGFPRIWDLPEAEVNETCCQVEGAECCRYELKWKPRPAIAWRIWAFGALAATAILGVHLLFAPGATLLWAGGFLGTGLALGAWLDRVARDRTTSERLEDQTRGMTRSMSDLQRRADDLHRANIELDQRVTERTAELTGALERLRQLDALKSEFFANVSHELRTPLTLILAPLDDRLGREMPPDERRLLEGLRRNASRLLRLIDDLLDLSRIDAGQLRLDLAALDMGAMARQLGLLFSSAAEARGLELVVEGPVATTDLWGDSHRLDSAVSNLLGNAFKFTPAGGTVTLRVEETDSEVKITVKDTGPGIAADDLPRIFDRYYQAPPGEGRRVGGVGIGLALARNLVELHGGRLSVESELGQGAAFTLALPRGKGHISPEVLERRRVQVEGTAARRASDAELEARPGLERGLVPRSTRSPTPQFEGRRARVLVVEDNPDVRAMLVELLSVTFEVLVAPDGSVGLAAVKKERPDLVLSDVMMPGLSGTELCLAIKADPLTAATPVILLTARGGTDAAIEGFASGADEFVEKPFHPRVLVARVQAQLKLRSLALQLALQSRLAAVGTLAAGVGHEVRNPVNAVLNGVRALQDRPGVDADDQRLLEVIAEGAERINLISGALLTHVSPGDGGGLRPVDPRAGLDSTLRLLDHRLGGVEVHREYQTDAAVVASAAELNQIFVNLIDNGLRAPAKQLWLSVKEAGEKVQICVADDGPGVPKDIAPRLFDPFFTTRSPGEGTGLGLYLSKQSLLRWGGDLRFADRPGGGTAFTVELPRSSK